MMTLARIAPVLALLAAAPAYAVGPAPSPNYLSFHVEALRDVTPTVNTLVGLSVDWGFFQNRYVATGTRIGLQRPTTGTDLALSLLAGPRFHIPLGERLLLIPALDLGLRLGDQTGMGYQAEMSLAFAYRQDELFFGIEGQTPIYVPSGVRGTDGQIHSLFPGFFSTYFSVNALVGFYY